MHICTGNLVTLEENLSIIHEKPRFFSAVFFTDHLEFNSA